MNCRLFNRPPGQPANIGTVTPAIKISRAIPYQQWPIYLKALAADAQPGDKGIGDILERKFGTFGTAYKVWYRRITGRSCGCEARKQRLNELYPLGI